MAPGASLFKAAEKGNYNKVKELLDKNPGEVKFQDAEGRAARRGGTGGLNQLSGLRPGFVDCCVLCRGRCERGSGGEGRVVVASGCVAGSRDRDAVCW